MSLRLLRAVWLLSLVVCPTGMLIVSLTYPDAPVERGRSRPFDPVPPLVVEILLLTHTCLSLAAAVGVFFIARWWPWRLISWVGIVLWFDVTFLFALGVIMGKTGIVP